MGLGVGELLLILVIVLLFFGGGRLSEVGAGVGKAVTNFKKAKGARERNITPPGDRITQKARLAADKGTEDLSRDGEPKELT
jgi:sec-independent protein translocase protein TatA